MVQDVQDWASGGKGCEARKLNPLPQAAAPAPGSH
jgi:hypothetical protein